MSFHKVEKSNERVKTCRSSQGSANHVKCLPICVLTLPMYTFTRANIAHIHDRTISRTNCACAYGTHARVLLQIFTCVIRTI